MKKEIISTILLFLVCTSLFADQKASVLLNRSQEIFKGKDPITAKFAMIEVDDASGNRLYSNGEFITSGGKFILDMPDTKSWYDGETLWTLIKLHQEVNVSTPSKEEALAMNPATLIGVFEKGYDLHYIGVDKTENKKMGEHIRMTNPKSSSSFSQVDIWVDPSCGNLLQIELLLPNKEKHIIVFDKITIDNQKKDQSFVFPENQYPDAEVIDLR